MSLIIVSNTDELTDALTSAAGGDRIELRSGDYGDMWLRDLHYSSEVVITAHDPGNPPVFNTVQLWEVDHLTFDGITFDYVPDENTVEWSAAFRGDNTSDIKILNSTVEGGTAIVGTDPDAEAGTQGNQGIIGYPVGVGIMFNNSADVTVENTVVSAFTKGARFNDTTGITFNDNEMFAIRKVPFATGNTSDVHIEGNYFHDITPWKFGGLGDHGDFIHIVTTVHQTKPNENIVIIDNYFAQGEGAAVLGIYLDDNNNNQGFRNVTIDNNVLHNGNAQGIRLEDVIGGTVTNNTLIQAGGEPDDAPRIQLEPGTQNVFVDNNIAAAILDRTGESKSVTGNSVGNNLIVQRHEPLSDGYVGNLFGNALTTYPTLDELRALSKSEADGFGAVIGFGDGVSGYIADTRGTDLTLNQHAFDLEMIEADGQIVNLGNAQVIWDFGDGQNGGGADVSHTYARAGVYETTATVTLPNGESYTLHKTIQVLSPIALVANFDGGAVVDGSDVTLDAEMIGDVRLVDSDNGQAIRLVGNNSAVEFKASEEITENPDFTISMAFKKDAANDAGRVMYFSGTANIDIREDGIVLRGSNSDDQLIVLQAFDIGLNDTDWHQITYSYSQTTGTATLYVDGTEVASMDGLTGIQHTTTGHGLHLGNPRGSNMDGLVDDVSFLRTALDADQVAEHYTAFVNGETSQYTMVSEVETIQGYAGSGGGTDDVVPDRDGDESAVRPDVPTLVTDDSTADVPTPPLPSGFIFGQETDQLSLGRMEHLEDSQQVSFTVEYANHDDSHEATRLVWNHRKVGVILKDDGVVLHVATEDEGFKQFRIDGLGLDDRDVHRLTVNLDAEKDRLQLLVDGEKVFEETQTDFDIVDAGGREFGWHLGSLWGGEFQGTILNFDAIDKFSFNEEQIAGDNDNTI